MNAALAGPHPGAPASVPGRRARLLFVGPLPPPIGGVETFTQAVLEADALRAFDLTHCDTTKGRAKSTQGRFDAGNFVWAARHFVRMARAVRETRPEVVYLPIAGTWSGVLRDLTLGWIARRSGARVIGHQHAGDFPRVLAHRGALAGVVRAGLGQFHRFLVLGTRWKTLLEDYGIAVPIEVCPSTARREVFERGAAFRRAPKREGTIEGLYVGQIGRRKGVLDLLAAVQRIRAMGLPFRITFVGPAQLAGELEAALEARRALGVEDVATFAGELTGDALYEKFRAADLFLLPSYNEGLPVVLYEAGAFGMPAITTRVGAIPDLIVDDRNGLFVEPGDVAALTDAIARLVRDHDARARLGAQLKSDVEAFHPDRVAAKIAAAVRAELERA